MTSTQDNFPHPYYISNGKKISRSAQHKDMYIVTQPDGIGWHNFTSTDSEVLKVYPNTGVPGKRVTTIMKKAQTRL